MKISLFSLLALVVVSGCAPSSHNHRHNPLRCCLLQAGSDKANLFVTNLGWHTGLVLPGALFPEFTQFVGEAPWLEFGWGDKDFYQSPDFSLTNALNAVFSSDGSVVHVVPFRTDPLLFFANAEVIPLRLGELELSLLTQRIRAEFARTAEGLPEPMEKSLYGDGRFFRGTSRFSSSFSCNSWTALLLTEIGCIGQPEVVRASSVMEQLRGIRGCVS